MKSASTVGVVLRGVKTSDLPIFFEQQLDPAANQMAAFTAKNPADRAAFDAHWTRLLENDQITKRTILFNGEIAGQVLSYRELGRLEVCYWIGREYWERGIATAALAQLVGQLEERPLYARVAKDNMASIRVLEKCGFQAWGHDRGFANARGVEIEEVIMKLE